MGNVPDMTCSHTLLSYLILMLTDQCNLSCRYCYLGENKKKPGQGTTMDTAIVDQAVEMAVHGQRPFHVQISGGEPFLEPELLAYTARRIRKADPLASIGIQTNATCLNKACIDLIQEFDLIVGVSLDGDPPVQDALRGRSSETFRGLTLLEEHQIPFNVTTVVSDANAESLHRLVMVLGGNSMARGIGLDLLVLKGHAQMDSLRPAGPSQIRSGITKMRRALSMVNQGRSIPLVIRELDKIRKTHKSSRPFCHAATGQSLAVTPQGYLYPCSQTAYDPQFFMGTIDQHTSPFTDRIIKHDIVQTCTDCSVKGHCPGDCPSRLHYNRNRGPNLFCSLYRALSEPDNFHSKLGI